MKLYLKSNTFKKYYGEYPLDYDISYFHWELKPNKKDNIKLIENDINNIFNYIGKDKFKLYFSCINDFNYILNNSNIIESYGEYIYLRIRKDIKLNERINYIIFERDLKNIDKNYVNNITLQIDNINELSIERLNNLIENGYDIRKVNLGQIPIGHEKYYSNYFKKSKELLEIDNNNYIEIEKYLLIHNDIFTVNTYKEIIFKLYKLIEESKINKEDSKYNKLYKIYNLLIHTLRYDFDEFKSNLIENQTLIGPLFNNKGVCEGISKLMYQLCSIMEIKTEIIGGGGSKEEGGHIWNQVFLNNRWYNIDVTYDSIIVSKGKEKGLFLVKDEKLKYKSDFINKHICTDDYKSLN